MHETQSKAKLTQAGGSSSKSYTQNTGKQRKENIFVLQVKCKETTESQLDFSYMPTKLHIRISLTQIYLDAFYPTQSGVLARLNWLC